MTAFAIVAGDEDVAIAEIDDGKTHEMAANEALIRVGAVAGGGLR
jgi:hypothetical protein